ncbi:MAG: M48 family metalloprotease [Magnetococcales bacterium]|nr:M48 family metalloprotease [Magnetococcales bacterium]
MQKSSLIVRLLVMTLLSVASHVQQGHAATVQLLRDPESLELLQHLGQPLIEAAGLAAQRPVQFHIILAPSVNAFALPNHHIVVNSGLLQTAQNPGEIVGVLAHELGHLAAGHAIQLQETARNVSVRTLITMAAGLVAGLAAKDGQIVGATLMGGAASGQSTLLDTMRQKEHQADQLAIHYLSRAHLSSEGMVSFMERINREQRLTVLPAPYLLTHPLNSQRVIELRDLAQAQQQRQPVQSVMDAEQQLFARVQAKLTAIQATDPKQFARELQQQMAQQPDTRHPLAQRYGLALAHRYAGELNDALSMFNQLLREQPDDPWLLRERALTYREQGHLSQAEADLRLALRHQINHTDLRYHLALVLSERKDPRAASHILRQLTLDDQEEASTFYLLGQVEEQLGRTGYSHLALARHAHLVMDLDASFWHYREAARTLPVDAPERHHLQSELAHVQKLRHERPQR